MNIYEKGPIRFFFIITFLTLIFDFWCSFFRSKDRSLSFNFRCFFFRTKDGPLGDSPVHPIYAIFSQIFFYSAFYNMHVTLKNPLFISLSTDAQR
ncbi:hypothetical protein BpHYR1_010675 [Brachionus plicatilis]|uniref:Uncharacterized protein n=1 Tax=Brachionus plicatilis TaxID=10195 RepID=A0A3M7PG68_BRAPC|nr:hypothetical protein BpHYR1_010675 [Brachionus plicatilis]